MTTFIYKFTDAKIETIPNDVSVDIVSYLADANDDPFIRTTDQILDTFSVKTLKSALPASGFESFLSIIASKFIGLQYDKTLSGIGINGSAVVSQITNGTVGTDELVLGLGVTGTGIPVDTTLLSIRDKNSVVLSNDLTATGSVTMTFSTTGWIIDFSEITRLVSIIDFAAL